TNPTNQDPTGTTLDETRRKRLLQICEELRLPIIEIDFTRPLTHPGKPAPPKTLYELSRNSGLVIHSGSLSDTVAPGIRVGWIVGSKAVIERLAETKHQMDKGTPSISQQIALHFLRSGYWLRNLRILRNKLGHRCKKMEQSLMERLGDTISWTVPNGGGYL
ncbi:PLP-dependent aminotransferase family protein, partial [Frankia sp. Cpl3]|nr:PLP-dependent aminotransferase family protein [Frankia sp. Cpl3]